MIKPFAFPLRTPRRHRLHPRPGCFECSLYFMKNKVFILTKTHKSQIQLSPTSMQTLLKLNTAARPTCEAQNLVYLEILVPWFLFWSGYMRHYYSNYCTCLKKCCPSCKNPKRGSPVSLFLHTLRGSCCPGSSCAASLVRLGTFPDSPLCSCVPSGISSGQPTWGSKNTKLAFLKQDCKLNSLGEKHRNKWGK